jgi:LacI family transcriptional regulator
MAHITQSDIAKKLGVTRITVSKALRNHPDISSEMKDKVKKTSEELGYIPNLVAKNMTAKKTFTLGVVIPDLENSFFAYATNSIIDAASEKNYNVFITVSRENQLNEANNIKNLIGMRVDGLLVCVTQESKNIKIFEEVKRLNIPLVFFDRQLDDLTSHSVVFADYFGAETAIDQIVAEGYTRIAYFGGYSNISIGRIRKEGYLYALEKNKLKIKNNWIIEGGYEVADGYSSFMKLYSTKKLPEIIFAVNDRVALGVYHAANEVGINIPNDIGLFAYGYSEIAQTFRPSLSLINQDPRMLGNIAVEVLMDRIQKENNFLERQILLKEEFVWNDSIKRKKINKEIIKKEKT